MVGRSQTPCRLSRPGRWLDACCLIDRTWDGQNWDDQSWDDLNAADLLQTGPASVCLALADPVLGGPVSDDRTQYDRIQDEFRDDLVWAGTGRGGPGPHDPQGYARRRGGRKLHHETGFGQLERGPWEDATKWSGMLIRAPAQLLQSEASKVSAA